MDLTARRALIISSGRWAECFVVAWRGRLQ